MNTETRQKQGSPSQLSAASNTYSSRAVATPVSWRPRSLQRRGPPVMKEPEAGYETGPGEGGNTTRCSSEFSQVSISFNETATGTGKERSICPRPHQCERIRGSTKIHM
eukprot:14434767-Alexandrium_andersonii.AAC.1